MDAPTRVLVYGATGRTGIVIDELLRRGLTPVLAGRSAARLDTVAARRRSSSAAWSVWTTSTSCTRPSPARASPWS